MHSLYTLLETPAHPGSYLISQPCGSSTMQRIMHTQVKSFSFDRRL